MVKLFLSKRTLCFAFAFMVLSFFSFISSSGAQAQEMTLKGRVISVQNGDTVTISHGPNTIVTKLFAVDAPKVNQPGGSEARQELQRLTAGKKNLTFTVRHIDQAGHFVVTILDRSQDINLTLVRNGYVRYNSSNCSFTFCRAYQSGQDEAQRKQLGIWKPMPR